MLSVTWFSAYPLPDNDCPARTTYSRQHISRQHIYRKKKFKNLEFTVNRKKKKFSSIYM